MSAVSSPATNETPRNGVPADIKMECVCTYKSDLGKLLVTDKYIQFRSLHYDEKIAFADVATFKKRTGGKIGVKVKSLGDTQVFGPFDAVRRGTVLETLKACRNGADKGAQNGGDDGGDNEKASIDPSTIDGLNDQILTDIFDESVIQGAIPSGSFIEPDDKDAVCIDETYPISIRNLFAVLLSDSSKFLLELHEQEGDIDLELHKWSLDESKAYHTRLFDFRKKTRLVNCLVHQTQNVRLKSPTELLVETSNKMEGVPFADCFTVDTKWRVKEEDDKCHVRIWVRVNFTKSVSLVKGKIERNSVQGTIDYFKAFAKMFRSKFSGGSGLQEIVEETAATTSSSSTQSPVLVIVLGAGFAFFFILWFWYWWSAGSMAAYVTELENRNMELEGLVEEIQGREPPPPLDMQEKMNQWAQHLDVLLDAAEKLRNEMIFSNDATPTGGAA